MCARSRGVLFFPLPVYGERVDREAIRVRGVLSSRERTPLIRLASLGTFSPQAGRRKTGVITLDPERDSVAKQRRVRGVVRNQASRN
jgi:hypothetical protein